MLEKRWLRSSLFFVLFAVCSIYTQRFCHRQTDGFAVSKIRSHLEYNPKWEVPHLNASERGRVHEILGQKFTYLAKGAQCHVFASKDGKWVLKFFRHHHMRPPLWLTLLPSFLEPWRSNKIEKKWSKLHKDFASYQIAYTQLKKQTGIFFLHLNKTGDLKQTVTIVDRLGIEHTLEMDEMEFILQKRATLVYPTIDAWMEAGNLVAAKEALSDLVSVLKLRFDKGLFDKDPDLNTNFGFIDNQAVQIDVGRFKREWRQRDTALRKDDIYRITDNLKQFLDQRYPLLSEHLQTEISNL